MAGDERELEVWVRDRLHDLVDFSDRTLAQYILAMAKKAPTTTALMGQLSSSGIPNTPAAQSFAQELMGRLPRRGYAAGAGKGGTAPKKLTQAEELRLSQQYRMVESDDEDFMAAVGTTTTKKEKEKGKKHLRKKHAAGEDEEDDTTVIRKRGREEKAAEPTAEAQAKEREAELDQDIKERDEFVQRLLEREDKKTKKKGDGSLTAEQILELATKGVVLHDKEEDLDEARKYSRREYLKKREDKKLQLMEKELRDEEALFEGVELTKHEKEQLELKKKILSMAKDANRFEVKDDSYQMPEGYETADGKIDKAKREAALTARYQEDEQFKTEQELWEERQLGTAVFRPGARDKPKPKDENEGFDDYVFEDQIEFVSDNLLRSKIEEERKKKKKKRKKRRRKGEDGMSVSESESDTASMSSDEEARPWDRTKKPLTPFEQLQEGRRKLPIYKYREEILSAVKDHQVLVLSAETGSGKTTQIPQYLHEVGYSKVGAIACTQPRRVAAMSVAARVSQEMGVKLGQEVGYSIRFENCTSDKTVVKYMTDGMLLREFLTEPDMASYSVIIIDEAHERTLHTDVLFGLCKDITLFRPDLRLIISSATLNAQQFSDYFNGAAIFEVPGRMYEVEVFYTKAPEADYLDAAVVSVLQIHISQPLPGDILVFLSGQEEIETADELLKQRTKGLGSRIKELLICPIYASLPSDQQAKIFEKTAPGARKVVLATNIAETSLTIDGICYVIDPGFCKQKSYNPRSGMESLIVTPVSQAAANQRKGRAGRTQAGKCFRLYTAWAFENEMDPQTVPEIQRTNMGNVVLMLMSIGITNIIQFDFMDKPPPEAIRQALMQLYALGAINERGELTKIGRRMAEFPLEPMLSKALLASEKYKCSDDVITIMGMLTAGNAIFYRPKDRAVHADNARYNFARGGGGDHLVLLRCYQQWEESNFSTQWCYENFVQVRSMRRARDIREQLQGLCERVEIEMVQSQETEDIRKAITAGFFFNCAKLNRSNEYETLKHRNTVYIHPNSVLAKDQREGTLHPYLIYHELAFTTKEYMRSITYIKLPWLLEVAKHYYDAQALGEGDKPKANMPRAVGAAPGKFDRAS